MKIEATHIWCKGCGRFTALEVDKESGYIDLMCADCKLVIASVKIKPITKGE